MDLPGVIAIYATKLRISRELSNFCMPELRCECLNVLKMRIYLMYKPLDFIISQRFIIFAVP